MRIIYCIPSLFNPGGMERVLAEKVNYLASCSDYQIYIVTTEQMGHGIRYELDSRIKLYHLDLDFNSHYSEPLFKKLFSHKNKIRRYEKLLIELINRLEIDICVSLCGKEIEFFQDMPVTAIKIAELHFGMNFRKQFIEARNRGLLWSLLGEIRTLQFKRTVKRLDKLVVLTENDKQQWAKTHDNVIRIPNPTPFRTEVVSNLSSKIVLSVGKLDPQKGYDMLIDAWVNVNKTYPDWKLHIFGQGELKTLLEEKIENNKLKEVVKLCGVSSQIQKEYIQSSIYVMSSRYEGLPMVLLEAMTYGLPIVSFNCEFGPSELIVEEMNGFLVEPLNVDELADKICLLICDDEMRKRLGKNASNYVKAFDKEIIMKQWIELFVNLLNKKL